ncbi:putative ADP-ribosylation factor-like protein 6 [Hypsibius exemplaris]|uniref:ADP-ribosylation factor-like protein 6 n=1 Tax=Hypsibius exemplaris TaxID=2072580 RepID=A0A1W0XB82_HYPEX|nr:putative ADP-ribosylation factor-like protein 6 [Hypsibius exemplaris]
MEACAAGRDDLVQLLIDHGSCVADTDNSNWNSLTHCAANGHVRSANVVMRHLKYDKDSQEKLKEIVKKEDKIKKKDPKTASTAKVVSPDLDDYMGILDKIANALGPSPRIFNILLVGLDNSGKTTLIHSLRNDGPKSNAAGDVPPTVGVQVEKFKFRNCVLHVHDMSGQGKYRAMWERCFPDCSAVVFVLDSSDRMRIAVAKDEFEGVMESQILKERNQVPFLIVANKKNQAGAMPATTLAQLLDMERQLTGRPWHLQATEAQTGEGVVEGFTWLIDLLINASLLAKAQE